MMDSESRIRDIWLRAYDSGLGVRVWGSALIAWDLKFGVWGYEFWVQGLGSRI
jgi:hypothetical protein